ncbi:MAG: Type 1 glutamine amidotransferase-like domain-containing protein [Candidatus Pacebacteria bacterium]|nr:Type 1 glutamine amidotransferase-like domain-containing protein [Candidatus Paceibacterota bacterium]
MSERIQIFIDGSNFYHLALEKLGIRDTQFDYDGFASFLASGRTISEMGKRLYVGTVKEQEGDGKSVFAMSRQMAFFSHLKSSHWEIKTSALKMRTEELVVDERVTEHKKLIKAGIRKIRFERLREKGIDVKLATDLITAAMDDRYDTAIVVSSDADLIPAIDWVRYRTKKKIEYVGFSIPDLVDERNSIKPLFSLIKKTDTLKALGENDLRGFVIKKLMLTSAGFANRELLEVLKKEIPKQAEWCRVLMISYTQNKMEESYVVASKKELESFGFKSIQTLNLGKPAKPERADVIYVCGGNTYAILQKMKETGIDKFIIEAVNKGALYIGVSAGSIIAGKTIDIVGWGSEGDANEVGLKDFSGLGFTDTAICPHYKVIQKDEVAEFKKKVSYPVVEITDNQMVFVRGNRVKKIGKF